MSKEATALSALKLALEALENLPEMCGIEEAITALREALASEAKEQPAQQQEPEYAWPTVADYERDVGFQTNEAFRIAWNMARTTNRMLGHTSSQPAQQEPIDQLIHAWQAIEETSGHVLDEGDVEGRMHMSVIRSAWEQMDSLVREIWDERGRP